MENRKGVTLTRQNPFNIKSRGLIVKNFRFALVIARLNQSVPSLRVPFYDGSSVPVSKTYNCYY